jgi:predicted permease
VSSFIFNKEEDKKGKTLKYGTIVSNGSFLGNPVIEGVYGSIGLFYAALFMLPVRVVVWTVGVSVFLKGHKENVIKKVLTHPCMIAMYVGAFFMFTGINLPQFISNTISGISNSNTPLSMMLVGMMLAEINPKGLINKTMVFYTFVRLIGVPAIVFAITAFLPIDPMLRGITIIMAGMPTPITTALLASKYGGDEKCATGMIFLSTIASMVTLPLWCLLF